MTYPRFHLIYRYIRLFDPFHEPSEATERIISRTAEWSDHIQAVSTQLFQPGINIAVDECIIRCKGRTRAKVTIPRKPTPTGLKLWVAAAEGYFLRWKLHIPSSARPQRPRGLRASRLAERKALAETQAVVLDLAIALPSASYHVFFDNLFSTPQLLRMLRERGIAATGTARVNSGIYTPFIAAKTRDNTGQLTWAYNEIRAVPTEDDQVNQIAWKDTALVLFLTTYFSGSEVESHERRRPSSTHPRARQAQLFFADSPRKVVEMPSIAVSYNLQMNAVDRGDQMRSYLGYKHRICRGPWQALAWTFLLDTVLINTYILQRKKEGNWNRYHNQQQWREELCNSLIARFHQEGTSRKRFRSGDEFTAYSQHKRVHRGKKSPCKACKGEQIGHALTRSSKRPALAPRDPNQGPRRATQTRSGCETCDVAICTQPDCWYFFHQPIIA